MINPIRSEQEAFTALMYFVGTVAVIVVIVLLIQAID